MIGWDDVSAVIPTRGDTDLTEVLASLPPFFEVIVWDNSKREDLAVYGRYAPIGDEASCSVIYVQDDDCVLAPESFEILLASYEPGTLVANMPERFRVHYTDSCLVGFGAIFDWYLPSEAFDKHGMDDPTFLRTCDVVFTTLTPFKLVDVPFEDLPWAFAPNRMWKQPQHVGERMAALERARRVRDGG